MTRFIQFQFDGTFQDLKIDNESVSRSCIYVSPGWFKLGCTIFHRWICGKLAYRRDVYVKSVSPSTMQRISPGEVSTVDESTLWWTNIAMENHHFSWENPLFLWPFSIAMLVHQRVTLNSAMNSAAKVELSSVSSHISILFHHRMWVIQCHNPPMTGNGKTYHL